MSDVHPDPGPELLQLAQKIMTVLDPLITAMAAAVPAPDGEPGKCRQVWCPVCAIAAIASGEHHPLNTIVVEHLAALRVVLQSRDAESPAASAAQQPGEARGRYQPIPVTVHD